MMYFCNDIKFSLSDAVRSTVGRSIGGPPWEKSLLPSWKWWGLALELNGEPLAGMIGSNRERAPSMDDSEVVTRLLRYLAGAFDCPDLAYAEAPARISGGRDAA